MTNPVHADIATLNRETWSRPDAVAQFARFNGFVDAGERVALVTVASRVRGDAALDIGVGAGRTVSLVRLLTDDYVGIDYSAAMVEACRRLHPNVDVRTGDVRDLTQFDDGRFGFVLFSFSGIDAVGHEDRSLALHEIFRVLRPGGWLMFSTHNMDGPGFHEGPWRGYRTAGSSVYRTARWIARFPLKLGRYARRWKNWWRHRRLLRIGEGWAIRAAAPHDFGIVIYYITLKHLLNELAVAGFLNVEVYDSEDGRRLAPDDDTRAVNAFYVVAQRAPR